MTRPVTTTTTLAAQTAQTKTAWVYIRESKEASASGHGPETQERLCRELAIATGYTITQMFLEIKPAASMRKRPTWKRVQQGVLRREVDGLLVWEYSRISRNTVDWMHFINRAVAAGVAVLSTDKQEAAIDWHSYMGRTMLAMIGGFNEAEREKTRQRTMQGNRTRALKGMPLVGPKAPYGYTWVEEEQTQQLTGASRARKVRMQHHPVEVARVRAIFDYFDADDMRRTFIAGANWLNLELGWPAPRGGLWTTTTLRNLLRQGFYWGEGETFGRVTVSVRVRDSVTGEFDTELRQRMRPKAERIPIRPDIVPPIVSRAQAMRVQRYVAMRNAHYSRTFTETTVVGTPSRRMPRTWNPADFWLMGGLLRCGVCGGRMLPERRGRRGSVIMSYACRSGLLHPKGSPKRHTVTMLARVADAFAVQEAQALLAHPERVAAAIARLAAADTEAAEELRVVQATLVRLEETMAAHAEMAKALTPATMARFLVVVQDVEQEHAALTARIAHLTAAHQHVDALAAAFARALAAVRDTGCDTGYEPGREPVYATPWSKETLQQVLRALGAHVVVRPKPDATDVRLFRKGVARLQLTLPLGEVYGDGDTGSTGSTGSTAEPVGLTALPSLTSMLALAPVAVGGLNILGGSVMSGNPTWAVIGPIVAIAGLILIGIGVVVGRRRAPTM